MQQAEEAGRKIKAAMDGDSQPYNLYFYTSPYKRSRQTYDSLCGVFDQNQLKGVQEEVQLREQDFGNFQVSRVLLLLHSTYIGLVELHLNFCKGSPLSHEYMCISGKKMSIRGRRACVIVFQFKLFLFPNAKLLVGLLLDLDWRDDCADLQCRKSETHHRASHSVWGAFPLSC